jgi:hypothetical protein
VPSSSEDAPINPGLRTWWGADRAAFQTPALVACRVHIRYSVAHTAVALSSAKTGITDTGLCPNSSSTSRHSSEDGASGVLGGSPFARAVDAASDAGRASSRLAEGSPDAKPAAATTPPATITRLRPVTKRDARVLKSHPSIPVLQSPIGPRTGCAPTGDTPRGTGAGLVQTSAAEKRTSPPPYP